MGTSIIIFEATLSGIFTEISTLMVPISMLARSLDEVWRTAQKGMMQCSSDALALLCASPVVFGKLIFGST